jgi:hypothetical protein
MMSFLQLAAEKKTSFLVGTSNKFGHSYFVRALTDSIEREKHSLATSPFK